MSKSSETLKTSVCLYSGGLDSTTVLYWIKSRKRRAVALTVDYGQLHKKEILFAKKLAQTLKIKHYFVKLSFPWKGSALIDKTVRLPQNRGTHQMKDIPVTYVPARNSVLLSLATSCAEAEGADEVCIGVNALDYSGYPDCRPEFINSFQKAMTLGTKTGVEKHPIKIQTPLLHKTKKDIIKMGTQLKVPFEKTWSCYAGKQKPCSICDSCVLRAKGFQEAGMTDPLNSAESKAHGA